MLHIVISSRLPAVPVTAAAACAPVLLIARAAAAPMSVFVPALAMFVVMLVMTVDKEG